MVPEKWQRVADKYEIEGVEIAVIGKGQAFKDKVHEIR